MDVRLLAQKYEKVRRAKSVTDYDTKLKKMIIEQGVANFVLCPIPQVVLEPISTPRPTHSFPKRWNEQIVELLSTVLFNVISNEVPV